jgi:excisionase family DNA binding protein
MNRAPKQPRKAANVPARHERDIWTREDVAAHYGCSLPHVHKLIADQGLPHMHLGALLRFRREDVLAWQTAQVKTNSKKGAA